MKIGKLLTSILVLSVLLTGVPVTPVAASEGEQEIVVTVVDGYGAPVPEAEVARRGFEETPPVTTNAQGEAVVDRDWGEIEVSKDGSWSTFYSAFEHRLAVPGAADVTLTLFGKATITGRLVDSDGAPVGGADISNVKHELYDNSWWIQYRFGSLSGGLPSATSSTDGTFELLTLATDIRLWAGTPVGLASGYINTGSNSVTGIGTVFEPQLAATIDLGDVATSPSAYWSGRVLADEGVIEFDVPGAIGVGAYAYNEATGTWDPFMYWMQHEGHQIGAGFAGLSGLPAGTYRFWYKCMAWLGENEEEPEDIIVFATAAGPSVLDVEEASSFTVGAGETVGVTFTVPAGRPATVPVTPVEGTSRIDTAIEASKLAFPDGVGLDYGGHTGSVVIATAYNWPDALGGSTLAGVLGGPILLVDRNAVPEAVMTELDRLEAESAYIVGGPVALGPAVEAALKAKLGDENVYRVAGGSRYATADAIAEKIIELTEDPENPNARAQLFTDYQAVGTLAFVATGTNFPDALAASPVAAGQDVPIFLSGQAGLSAETVAVMDEYGVTDVVILGGEGAVSSAVEASLVGKYGATHVDRIGGASRYDTAVQVAEWATSEARFPWSPTWSGVAVATGAKFPDALAGGVMQGMTGSIMLLTKPTSLDSFAQAALEAHKYEISHVRFLGGEGAVSQAVRAAVVQLLQ